MAGLVSLLQEVRGIYTDRPRDRLPVGSVWEMTDFVPLVLQAGVRNRGAWTNQLTGAIGAAIDGMHFARFRNGPRLMAVCGPYLVNIPVPTVSAHGYITNVPNTRQNPFMHRDNLIIPATDGTSTARQVTFDGANFTATPLPPSSFPGRVGVAWKDRTVLANSAANPTTVGFSKVGVPTQAWDANSLVPTSQDVTGLAAIGNTILVLHADSVERLRGSIPPDSTLSDPTGDLVLDTLADRVGCFDPRSIAYWNENVLFADASGITMTDAATVRNLIQQAGDRQLWQQMWLRGGTYPLSAAGVVHQNYYIVTLRQNSFPPVTFVFDLPTRRLFQFSNIDAVAWAFVGGTQEALFAALGSTMVANMTPLFNPNPALVQTDGNGIAVLPSIATAFSLLSKDIGFKRIHDVHLTYEAHRDDALETMQIAYVNAPTGSNQVFGEFPPATKYTRRAMSLNRRLPGLAVRLQQLQPTRDTRLYDISVRAFPEEEHRL